MDVSVKLLFIVLPHKVKAHHTVKVVSTSIVSLHHYLRCTSLSPHDLQYVNEESVAVLVRRIHMDVLEEFGQTVERLMEEINEMGGATVASRPSRIQIPPCDMDSNFQKHLSNAAEVHASDQWKTMPSGAFHDAGILQEVIPCGMLFIPSIGGVSHDFSENSHNEDIILGCQVMADAAASLLQEKAS